MPDDEEDVRAVQAIERIINSDPDSAFTRARLAGTTFARPKLLVTAIGEQADLLGIELEKYWWIAARSLLAPLPDKWAQYKDAQEGRLYYLNESSGESSWEHPLDDQYRRMHSRYAEDDAQGVDGWVSPSVHEQSVLAEKRRQDAAYAKLRGDFFTDTSKSAMTFASDEEEEEPPSRRRGGRRSDDARARSDYARSDYARSDASDGDAPRTSRAGRGEYAPQQRRPQHYPDDARYEDDRYEDDRYDDARYDAPPRPPQGGDDYKAYPPRPQQPHDRDPQRSQRDGGQRDGSRDGSQRDGSRDGGQRDGAPRQPAYEQRQRQGRPSEDDEQRKGRPYDADADFDFEDSDARRGYADDAPYSKSDHSNGREAGNGREAARSSGREAWSRRSKAGSPRRDENGRGPAFRDRSYEREARPESPGRRAAKAVLEEAAGGLRRSASLDRPDRTPPNRTGPLQTRPDQQVWDRPGQSPTREPRDEEPAYARTTRVAAPRNEEPAPAPCASSSPASLNAANPGEARSIGVEEALRQEIKALQAEKLAHCERLDAEKERGSKIVAIAERETAAAKRDRDAAVEALQVRRRRRVNWQRFELAAPFRPTGAVSADGPRFQKLFWTPLGEPDPGLDGGRVSATARGDCGADGLQKRSGAAKGSGQSPNRVLSRRACTGPRGRRRETWRAGARAGSFTGFAESLVGKVCQGRRGIVGFARQSQRHHRLARRACRRVRFAATPFGCRRQTPVGVRPAATGGGSGQAPRMEITRSAPPIPRRRFTDTVGRRGARPRIGGAVRRRTPQGFRGV
ncbi:hypothetical protein M885DRAFT_82480 [Pelagophyceae sp. CCMP2097]|nr:hypothetical protein M885DRAFT_82480 [Pelagophyceae sp. CCMP2097]